MNPKLSLLFLFFTALVFSCSKENEALKIPDAGSIYFNSFENSMDVENFEGMQISFSNDTPTGGGDSSIVVAGGCIVPHLYIELGPFDQTESLSFSIYGKSIDREGGSVNLALVSNLDEQISIVVEDFEWTFYQSENILEVPAGEKIRVEFLSGGIIPLVTAFDLLKIENEN